MKRTRIALAVAVLVVTTVAAVFTMWLRSRDAAADVSVSWISWWLGVAAAYAGLTLVGWWVRDRERRR